MKTLNCQYETHLAIQEFVVPAGGELPLRLTNWTVIQIGRGTGYFLQPNLNQALETKAVLLVAGCLNGSIRASQLSELSCSVFSVIPARLTGLITIIEQAGLEVAAARKENIIQVFSSPDPVVAKMEELHAGQNRSGLRFRVKLLQLFVELVGDKLEQTLPTEDVSDAKQRLQLFLKQTPTSELLEMNFNELAQKTHCTSRHLGRIFKQLVGLSFSAKRDALRLERAQELLATSNSKIVDVALESGYKSLSHFNHMFARNFGISPGKWRKINENQNSNTQNKPKAIRGKSNVSFSSLNATASSGQVSDKYFRNSVEKQFNAPIFAKEAVRLSSSR